MFPVLALAFLAVPVAELAVLIAVGSHIGFLNTFALLLALSVVGAWLARREGLGAWRRLQAALVEGRMPTAEVADGALILLAGALLLTPGFLTDVVGVLLLLPPVRAVVRRWLPALLARRVFGGGRRRYRVRVVDGRSRPGGTDGGPPSQPPTTVAWGAPEVERPPQNPPSAN
jgi:UPF0716 protein FxsA